MLKQLLTFILFGSLGYAILASDDFKVIASGIAIFMVGMYFMEEGFKAFAGGILERFLEKTTDTLLKAIFSGFFVTSIVQSSSLVTVIAISFLSADLIGLAQAIGIVFGSNIGTTTTAWIVATLGVKVKIAYYAMPMLIFGVVLRFMKAKTPQGIGTVLLGLGFVFLGISYMKEGFDTLKAGIDLAEFAIPGMMGILIYILVGAVATIVIQSSSATMAIIITALASGQIIYINALALAIGANIGTTVTAVIGSLASNENGKRLAVAHVIFNVVTAVIAIVLIHQLAALVDLSAKYIGISEDDYVMKLALFHTFFNIIGVLAVAPFAKQMVRVLEQRFIRKEESAQPKYLDNAVIEMAEPALAAIQKETERLYDKSIKAVAHALQLHRHDIWSDRPIGEVVTASTQTIPIDVDSYYQKNIKGLYGEILKFSTMAQVVMEHEDQRRTYELKLANRDIVEALKDVRELQKNIARYIKSPNTYVQREYNMTRKTIATLLRGIENVRQKPNDILAVTQVEVIKQDVQEMDEDANRRIDELVRNDKITTHMATSLMNDSAIAYDIVENLLEMATILWIKDADIRRIGLAHDKEKE
ncbi:MAG: Na/Pi cotransporter family protein [Campylobacterota bacterium]|nr:Na/Pi cotransporter family protein [Campylobacterota bacterium]